MVTFSPDLISLISLGLALMTLVLLLVVLFVLGRASEAAKKFAGSEKIDLSHIEGVIEEKITSRFEEVFAGSTLRIDAAVKNFVDEMTKLSQQKSQEIGGYIEKAQIEQVRESQFFVANMLSRIEKEVEEYRKNKLSRVDEEIRGIVLAAAREVIGRAISLSEHEDLVTKALERAKKDQLFA